MTWIRDLIAQDRTSGAAREWNKERGKRMTRAKLGLALAGGGFRASLFHVGVLRRMAEMDILRYVQVLSTVSGGSIVGALYILLLKRELENPERKELGPEEFHIKQEVFEAIVKELQDALVVGIRKNLRTRLFANPWTLIKVMLWKTSLAGEMGRLYEKHIFATAKGKLKGIDLNVLDICDRVPLMAIRMRKKQVGDAGGTEQYNHRAIGQGWVPDPEKRRAAATRLILNTTSLNSGARFWFSSTELGDWYLGHARYDEIDTEILPRKILRDLPPDARKQLIGAWPDDAGRRENVQWNKVVDSFAKPYRNRWFGDMWMRVPMLKCFAKRYDRKWDLDRIEGLKEWGKCPTRKMECEFVRWQAQVDRERADVSTPKRCSKRGKAIEPEGQDDDGEIPLPWHGPLDASEFRALVTALLDTDAGRLREVKNYAWYLAHGRHRKPRVDAGMKSSTLWVLFCDALKSIDETRARRLEEEFKKHFTKQQGLARPHRYPEWCKQLLDSVLNVYYCKTAAAISPNIRDEWNALPLADAVAASAAFPPVFPPYQLYDLYDDMHVQVLSLTDGGPFDNIGVTALLDEHCNYVIASDTGAPFDTRQSKAAVGRIGLMGRLSSLLMNRPAQLYRHDLRERRRLGSAFDDRVIATVPPIVAQFAAPRALKGLASFDIGSTRLTADLPHSAEPGLLARIRTDLDLFGDVEIKALINRGYLVADHHLQEALKDSPFGHRTGTNGMVSWPPAKAELLPIDRKDELEKILNVGKHRLFRALRLGEGWSSVVAIVVVAGVVGATWHYDWKWADVYAAIDWIVTKLLVKLLVWDCFQKIQLRWALPIAILTPLVWWFIKECLDPRVLDWGREKAAFWRKLLGFWKNLKGAKGNLLWAFKALPVVALVVAPVAWVSYGFAKLFQRATRDPRGLPKDRS
ncbi:MAG: patatin-like phospholipase family protein [Thiobacillus sp.]|nr:patatin-like phospholipase family protein [Thiobacillus sp.]